MGKRKPVSLLTSLPSSLRKEILEKRLDEGKEVEAKDSVERIDYDALLRQVERYDKASQVPQFLKKYYAQRTRYFSLYNEGCILDMEGWYSITPESIANHIAERCRCDVILDPFCGVGGNVIAFAFTCEFARHNARIYGVEDRIEFILGDYTSFAASYPHRTSAKSIDVVFLSPPWGGPSYLTTAPSSSDKNRGPKYSLSALSPLPGSELIELTRNISNNIALYVPRNTDLHEVSKLTEGEEKVEVEEEWMGDKLKALTCYFGELVVGNRGENGDRFEDGS